MTYAAPDKVPYDAWFDPNYKYEPHPYDNWPMATEDLAPSSFEPQDESEEIENEKTLHQKMYEIATSKYNPFAVGGSESIQDKRKGGTDPS